jgi:mono/diheme cytochrome c family protein
MNEAEMYKTTRLIVACLIATALSGCGNSDYTPTTGAAADQLFAEACAGCHGDNGEGKFGFLLSIAGSEESSETIVAKIRNGGHLMPAFPQLSEEQASAIAGYLKSK